MDGVFVPDDCISICDYNRFECSYELLYFGAQSLRMAFEKSL